MSLGTAGYLRSDTLRVQEHAMLVHLTLSALAPTSDWVLSVPTPLLGSWSLLRCSVPPRSRSLSLHLGDCRSFYSLTWCSLLFAFYKLFYKEFIGSTSTCGI